MSKSAVSTEEVIRNILSFVRNSDDEFDND